MLQIVQAFDREPIAEIPTDDADALEAKLEAATRAFRNRNSWPKPHECIAVLRRLAALMEPRRDHLSRPLLSAPRMECFPPFCPVGRGWAASVGQALQTCLARQIAREGGKPLSDALVEVGRAIDGVLNA